MINFIIVNWYVMKVYESLGVGLLKSSLGLQSAAVSGQELVLASGSPKVRSLGEQILIDSGKRKLPQVATKNKVWFEPF